MKQHASRIMAATATRSMLILLAAVVSTLYVADARAAGRFLGPVRAEMGEDGGSMTLLEPLVYVDSGGHRWEVPAGVRFNGASIPRVFWSTIGGPYEGKYRTASIIHDYYCDVRLRSWQSVHRMFYDAMISSGVDLKTAKIMYLAVLYGGPRWDDQAIYNTQLAAKLRGGPSSSIFTAADPQLDEQALGRLREAAIVRSSQLSPAERRSLQDPELSTQELSRLVKEVSDREVSLDEIDQLATQARLGTISP